MNLRKRLTEHLSNGLMPSTRALIEATIAELDRLTAIAGVAPEESRDNTKPLIDSKSALGGIAKALSFTIAAAKEKLIKAAISHVIGHGDWETIEISKRGKIEVHPDGIEVFCFDDKGLIEFHPMKPTIEDAVMGVSIKGIQEYRLLYTPKENGV